MNIGYAYWGFLADEKYDKDGNKLSTPDGNAFYSWSIINSLQERGHIVWQMMPNRDKPIEFLNGKTILDSFTGMGFGRLHNPRYEAYKNMKKYLYDYIEDWKNVTEEELFKIWDFNKINNLDAILLEWRMEIPGRNTLEAKFENKDWQPDLFIQQCIIDYCSKHNIKLIIFDLDYKLSYDDVHKLRKKGVDYFILELGYKWQTEYDDIRAMHVEVPFDFRYIDNYRVHSVDDYKNNLVYVGSRYERDWCVEKYIPTEMYDIKFYGNWLENGRDSKQRWPHISFGKRITANEMYEAYDNSVCTILLAKSEYLQYGFMTVRIIESIYYGVLPLFIEEYGQDVIERYAGTFAKYLMVDSRKDVIDKVMYYKYNEGVRRAVILYLRGHLRFMDSSIFIDTLEEVVRL